jgi:hypothetical protein
MNELKSILGSLTAVVTIVCCSVSTCSGWDCEDNSSCFSPPYTPDSCGGDCGISCFGISGLPAGASYCAVSIDGPENVCCYVYTVAVVVYNDGWCSNGPLCSCVPDPNDPGEAVDIGICG